MDHTFRNESAPALFVANASAAFSIKVKLFASPIRTHWRIFILWILVDF